MSKPYIPDADSVQMHYAHGAARMNPGMRERDAEAEFDRFIAQVKRDAGREALDGLLDTWGISQTLDSDYEVGYSSGQRDGFGRVITYRDTHYPEETPVDHDDNRCSQPDRACDQCLAYGAEDGA